MEVAVLIPARGGSKTIPRKNLAIVAGRPLIAWSLLQADEANIRPIYVTTDDEEIANAAYRILPRVTVIQEPTRDGTTTMEEVIRYGLPWMGKLGWLVLLQPTSPLRLVDHITESVRLCAQGSADSVVSVTETRKFYWQLNEIAGLTPVLHDRHRRSMRQTVSPWLAENGSIYVMRVSTFLEEGTRFCGRTLPYVMPDWTATEVDSSEDLDMVRLILADRLRQGKDGVRN